MCYKPPVCNNKYRQYVTNLSFKLRIINYIYIHDSYIFSNYQQESIVYIQTSKYNILAQGLALCPPIACASGFFSANKNRLHQVCSLQEYAGICSVFGHFQNMLPNNNKHLQKINTLTGGQGAVGSNPIAPTKNNNLRRPLDYFLQTANLKQLSGLNFLYLRCHFQ